MSKHEHFKCEHELSFCGECDIPYCKKCGKEWGNKKIEPLPVVSIPMIPTASAPPLTDFVPGTDIPMPRIVNIDTGNKGIIDLNKSK